jgi:hypothetical protein
MSKKEIELNRRDFVKGGFAAAGTAFCYSLGLREAIAMARARGLAVLTEGSLNQKFAEARVAGTLRALASDIKADPIAWLKAQYSMTEIQLRAIKSIRPSDWSEIKRVLAFVEEKRGASLKVVIAENTRAGLSTEVAFASFACFASVKVTAEAQVGPTTVKAQAEVHTS